MKHATVVGLLAASAMALAVPLDKRQHGHDATGAGKGGMSMGEMLGSLSQFSQFMPASGMKQYSAMATKFMPKQKAMKIEEITPVIRKDAKRVRITYGPYKIRGTADKSKLGSFMSFDKAGTSYMSVVDSDFPRDVTLLDTTSAVTDEKYKPIEIANGLYNHHNVFYNMAEPPPQFVRCPGQKKATSGIPVTLFVAGATEALPYRFTSNDGSFNSGYYITKDAGIFNLVDVVNYNNDTRTVYTVSELEYLPGKVGVSASQDVLNIGMCTPGLNGMSIRPEAGQKQIVIEGKPIELALNATLINLRAHLHDGGVNTVVKLNGKEICDSKATYGGPGHEGVSSSGKKWESIQETTSCDNLVKVKAGDQLQITAHYDLDMHPPRESPHGEDAEDMALLLATFAVDA